VTQITAEALLLWQDRDVVREAAGLCRLAFGGANVVTIDRRRSFPMNNFKLSGDDIELRYQDDALHVQSKTMPLAAEGRTFPAGSVRKTESGLGEDLTVLLLNSDRKGRSFSLHVIVPKTSPSDNDIAIDGLAIVVTDHSGEVGGPPNVLQSYDVRHLTGTMSAASA
jgi:hypothetical protein